MGAWGFVFLAYGVVWCALVLYVFGLWRRLRSARAELAALAGDERKRESSGSITAALLLAAIALFSAEAQAQSMNREDVFAYMLGQRPVIGHAGAPVAMIELSDFQCGFCRRFWRETLPAIDKNYIQSGQVRFIYHHMTVLGKFSVAAAQAAECAAEQGAFWPYHDKLFENGGSPLAFTQNRLKGYARELKLRPREFDSCVQSGRYGRKIDKETAMGVHLGVRGTPAFFVNGALIVGAQPLGVFEKAFREALREPKSDPR